VTGVRVTENRILQIVGTDDDSVVVKNYAGNLVVHASFLPYRGASAGLTTYLRRLFGSYHYVGIELEINRRWPRTGGDCWRTRQQDVIQALVPS
jgi:hypothetical protein